MKKTLTCELPECADRRHSRGFCKRHYAALRAHGDPRINRQRRTECRAGHPTTDPSQRTSSGRCRQCGRWMSTQAWKIMRWTEREYLDRIAAQDGACRICCLPLDLGVRKGLRSPVFDHCHSTGQGRGIICLGCNTAIGYMSDDPVRLEAAAEYLRASRLVTSD